MIIGSGLLAQAFTPAFSLRADVCIYAAGVSNSSCTAPHEFARERERLLKALDTTHDVHAFVYFSTCSIADPEAKTSPYVQHKIAMEQLVTAHPRYLILRLPQVAGKTPNPHTLLNYLHAHISRSEEFQLWQNAYRNIIDVDDVAAITTHLIADPAMRSMTLNIASPDCYPMTAIVHAMEKAVGKHAIYESIERGSHYPINIPEMLPILDAAGVKFGPDYLDRVIGKYYGKSH